jgi:hypothetical protein
LLMRLRAFDDDRLFGFDRDPFETLLEVNPASHAAILPHLFDVDRQLFGSPSKQAAYLAQHGVQFLPKYGHGWVNMLCIRFSGNRE